MVNLEGLAPIPGFRKGTPTDVIDQWLATLRAGPHNRRYASHEELAVRLRKTNSRLSTEHALFFAREFSRARADGGLEFDVDPFQRVATPWFGHQEVVDLLGAGHNVHHERNESLK